MADVVVRELAEGDAAASVEVMLAAFPADPNMQWCFLGDEPGYLDRMRGYFEVGHAWHTRAGFPVLGAYDGDALVGVSYVMGPNPEIPEDDDFALVPRMREACGDRATDRFARYNEATEAKTPATPAHCIALLAVDPSWQGKGVGGRIVARVIADSEASPDSRGIVLDTGNPRNLSFYRRHGFQEVARVEYEGPDEWVLFRPCPGD